MKRQRTFEERKKKYEGENAWSNENILYTKDKMRTRECEGSRILSSIKIDCVSEVQKKV